MTHATIELAAMRAKFAELESKLRLVDDINAALSRHAGDLEEQRELIHRMVGRSHVEVIGGDKTGRDKTVNSQQAIMWLALALSCIAIITAWIFYYLGGGREAPPQPPRMQVAPPEEMPQDVQSFLNSLRDKHEKQSATPGDLRSGANGGSVQVVWAGLDSRPDYRDGRNAAGLQHFVRRPCGT